MKELYPLFGIVTVLNTPFARDDTIDMEIRIYEGMQFRIGKVIIKGNTMTAIKLEAEWELFSICL